MLIARIAGTTRVLGQSQGYLGLPVRDQKTRCSVNGPETAQMISAWEPTPDELQRLNQGAKVELSVLGTNHPPVMLAVGDVPTYTGEAAATKSPQEERPRD